MEELADFLPVFFKTQSDGDYVAFLWDAFASNYTNGKYARCASSNISKRRREQRSRSGLVRCKPTGSAENADVGLRCANPTYLLLFW